MRNTIKSGATIDRLFSSGTTIKSRNLIVLFDKAPDGCGHNAFIAGKRLGAAPLRNRAKRRMRAVVAQTTKSSNYNIAFMARQNTASCAFDDLIKETERAHRKIIEDGERDDN